LKHNTTIISHIPEKEGRAQKLLPLITRLAPSLGVHLIIARQDIDSFKDI